MYAWLYRFSYAKIQIKIYSGIKQKEAKRSRKSREKGVKKVSHFYNSTVCPRRSDSFYIVSYYIKWVTTSWVAIHRLCCTVYKNAEMPRNWVNLFTMSDLS